METFGMQKLSDRDRGTVTPGSGTDELFSALKTLGNTNNEVGGLTQYE